MADDWIAWSGGNCPVAPEDLVDFEQKNGVRCQRAQAKMLHWSHSGVFSDIVAYRLSAGEQAPIARPAAPDDLFSAPGYEKLAKVLAAAYLQASEGKGHERHASGEPFHEQPICAINRLLGSIDGALYQVSKKGHEARRLPRERAVKELLGAINYAAACVILVEEGILDKPGESA